MTAVDRSPASNGGLHERPRSRPRGVRARHASASPCSAGRPSRSARSPPGAAAGVLGFSGFLTALLRRGHRYRAGLAFGILRAIHPGRSLPRRDGVRFVPTRRRPTVDACMCHVVAYLPVRGNRLSDASVKVHGSNCTCYVAARGMR
jgi:hypothetical protein